MVVYNPSKIKSGFDYNELFEFNDFLPTFAEAAGVPLPETADGRSIYPLLANKRQAPRETIFIHYDPLKSVRNDPPFGRFVRDKEYKLYNDNRFYRLSHDAEEKRPIPDSELTGKERLLKEQFQAELDMAPPYYFKQSSEYRKKK